MSPKAIAIGCCCVPFMTGAVAQQGEQSTADRSKQRHLAGHSQFGEACDEGPREKPTRIVGIGSTYVAKHGGAPFDDFKFLTIQLQRLNEKRAAAKITTTAQ